MTGRVKAALDWLHLYGRRPPLWLELLFVAWLCWLYDMVANLAPVRAGEAHRDSGWILGAEKFLHLDPEASLEHWLAGHPTLALALSNYYDNAHFVITLGLVGALWWLWPEIYRPLRNTMVVMNLAALAVFLVFPAAPPRLFDPAVYPDLVASTHAFGSWHSGTLGNVADQFAAMPSLHIGWACWSSLAGWRIVEHRRSLRGGTRPASLLQQRRPWVSRLRHPWWVWLYPAVTAWAVMATGNHFLFDLFGGVAVFAGSVVVADRWQARIDARRALRLVAESDLAGAAVAPAHAYEASTHQLPDSQ
jgi:hypothetical protein